MTTSLRALGTTVLMMGALALAGCGSPTPEPTIANAQTPTPTIDPASVVKPMTPQVSNGAWLDRGYADGIERYVDVPGQFCALTPDPSVVVTYGFVDASGERSGARGLRGFSTATGEQLWRLDRAECPKADNLHGFAILPSPDVSRLDFATGEQTLIGPRHVDGKIVRVTGNTDAIVLTQVIAPDSPMVAYDVDSGEKLWELSGDDYIECLVNVPVQAPLVCSVGKDLMLVDQRTGARSDLPDVLLPEFFWTTEGVIVTHRENIEVISIAYDADGNEIARSDAKTLALRKVPAEPAGARYSAQDIFAPGIIPPAVTESGDPVILSTPPSGEAKGPSALAADGSVMIAGAATGSLLDDGPSLVDRDGNEIEQFDMSGVESGIGVVSNGLYVVGGFGHSAKLGDLIVRVFLPAG